MTTEQTEQDIIDQMKAIAREYNLEHEVMRSYRQIRPACKTALEAATLALADWDL